IVITAKNGNSTAPVAYMWCAHTVMESAAIAIVANTSPLYPKIGLREDAGKISETIPKNGRAMMYTSGCAKNQKKCGDSIGPHLAGAKIWDERMRAAAKTEVAQDSMRMANW